ncbi:hypothetical protein L3Q82_020931, partial [Scortum barcoo]
YLERADERFLQHSKDQYAYRKNRSTEDAISSVVHTALTHLENKDSYVRQLFTSAFNTIIPQTLVQKLTTLGLSFHPGWCRQNNLCINVKKTKEMIVDFRRGRLLLPSLYIDWAVVEVVSSFRYLGVHISDDLTWSNNNSCLIRKAHHQRLYFLRRLRRAGQSLLDYHAQKFSDDSAVAVGLITDGDDREYRGLIQNFVDWCLREQPPDQRCGTSPLYYVQAVHDVQMALQKIIHNTPETPYSHPFPVHVTILDQREDVKVLSWTIADTGARPSVTKRNVTAANSDRHSVAKITLYEAFASKAKTGQSYMVKGTTCVASVPLMA